MPRSAEKILSAMLFVFDSLVMHGVFIGVFYIWLGGLESQELYYESYVQVRYYLLALYVFLGLYGGIFNVRRLSTASESLFCSSQTLLLSFISFNLITFLSRSMAAVAHTFPRPIFLLATVFNILAVFLIRAIILPLFRPEAVMKRAVIIGDEAEARRIIRHFHRRGGVRFRIVKVLKSEQLDELASEVVFRHAHEVFVTDSDISLDGFWAQIYYGRREEPHSFKVRIAIDPRKAMGNVGLQSLEDFPLLTISSLPLTKFQRFYKRLFDICFSVFAIIISFPAMIVTAVLMRIDSPGSLFYKQKRVGRYGKEFNVVKFRSMRPGAEAGVGPQVASADDPRVSRLGHTLRRLGLDELPQFFLVLTGEMSVVGPRPERPFFVREYHEFQGRRLSVKPGITGLAAVNSRYYLRMTDKVAYDYFYLDKYSLLLDIKIVFQTVWVLLFESTDALQDQHHKLDKMKKAPEDDKDMD